MRRMDKTWVKGFVLALALVMAAGAAYTVGVDLWFLHRLRLQNDFQVELVRRQQQQRAMQPTVTSAPAPVPDAKPDAEAPPPAKPTTPRMRHR